MATKKAAGKPGANDHITDIEHEPVVNNNDKADPDTDFSEFEQETDVEVIPLDQRISTEIAKYNLADDAIATIKKKCSRLTIANVDDKTGFKKVKEAWQHVRQIRLAVGKKHKTIKEDYLAITRAIDGEKNRLTEMLEPIEERLKNMLDKHENELQEIKNKAEKEAQQRLEARVKELEENGVRFNGAFYAIGEAISLDVVTLKDLDEPNYADLLTKVKAENARLIEAEQKRQQQEELERQQQQQLKEENERKEKELEEQRKKLEEQAQKMLEKRTGFRGKELEALGMKFVYTAQTWAYENSLGTAEIFKTDVDTKEDDEWEKMVENVTQQIKELKEQQAQRDIQAQQINDRTKELNALGLFRDGARFERKSQYHKVPAVFIGIEILNFDGLQYATNLEQLKQQVKDQQDQEVIEAQKPIMIKARLQQLRDLFGLVEGDGDYIRISKFATVANMQVDAAEVEDKTQHEWETYIDLLKDQYKNILEVEKEQKIIADQQAETERNAGLSDTQRVKEFVNKIAAIDLPEISTEVIKSAFDNYLMKYAAIESELLKALPKGK